jgi:ferredoxin-NADP reductase
MPDRILTARVARLQRLTDEVMAVDLVAAHGPRLPTYAPGAHIDLHLPGGYMRSYSLAESPARAGEASDEDGIVSVGRYRIGIKREEAGRGGSASAHSRLAVGDLVAISVPRCTFPMPEGPEPLILLAGGIGLTPLLAMAQQRVERGLPVELHVFARTRSAVPFVQELGELEEHTTVMWHLDEVLKLRGIPVADRVRELLAHAGAERPPIAVCGPDGFMQAVRAAAANSRPPWPAERLQWEYFAPPGSAEGDRTPADHPAASAFVLRLVRQQVDVPVAADQSAVEALHEIGIDVAVSCQQGVCGTCVVPWQRQSGAAEPEHHDHCLTDTERASRVALCCMRSRDDRRPVLIDL